MKGIKKSPPYIFAVLCFIPLLGGIVGLILMYYGIFRYKDKVITIFGMVGIAISVGIYGVLFYDLKHKNVFQKGWVNLTLKQLKHVADDLERYKTLNGHYPQSLEELKRSNNFLVTVDVFSDVAGEKLRDYQYQKNDSTYVLYSVGPDGLPNTTDDIFPE